MDEKLIQNTANKLGFRQNLQVLEKIKENTRLLQLKQNPMISTIGEMVKVVLCTDLAASAIGLPFETDVAVKMCGIRRSIYANYRRIIQKLIGATRDIGIPELCLQLGLPAHVQETAAQELPKYLAFMEKTNQELDRKHPQYVAVVVYRIARQKKIKVSKTAFTSTCSLRLDQWKLLEESWEKYEKESLSKGTSNQIKISEDEEMPLEVPKEVPSEETEDYEVWKERILAKAYENLRKK